MPLARGSETPFSGLLLAVFNSILEVFILCAAGYILARNGILDKKTQKQINRLNVSLFTPALLFSKVAYFLTPAKLKELWIIPIWFVVVTTTSMVVGRVLGTVFRLRKSQKSFVMAAGMFMNSNALPIALMQSLVVSVPDLAWGPDDNKNVMLGRALTYLTMYSTLGMVVRYSYGVSLLSKADTILVAPSTSAKHQPPNERTPLLPHAQSPIHAVPSTSTIAVTSSSKSVSSASSRSNSPTKHQPRRDVVDSPEPIINHLPELSSESVASAFSDRPRMPVRRNTTFYNSFPNSPNNSRTNLAHYDSRTATDDETTTDDEFEGLNGRLPTPTHHAPPGPPSKLALFAQKAGRRIFKLGVVIYNFMTVPLWAALVSLIVACAEPVKHALEFHMKPLNNAINTAGKCAVPVTLVVLGAYFYVPPPEGEDAKGKATEGKLKRVRKADMVNRTIWEWTLDTLRIPRYRKSSTPPPTRDEVIKPPKTKPGETKTVVLAVLSRMVITPLLLIPLVMLATKFDWHAVFEDPVFVTVNTILLCSPPALTLAQITAAVSGDAFERLISRTIFWSYCVATPPVTILCVLLGLWLAKF